MATNTYVELDIPGLQLADDLAGVRDDLASARTIANRLAAALEPPHADQDLVSPLTTALLVQYARAFDKKRGERLREFAESLEPERREAHEAFIHWRSKHIAHSVNGFERNLVVARYWVERVQDEGIESISVQTNRVVGLAPHDVSVLQGLIETFHATAESALEDELERLLGVVRELPLSEVLAGPNTRYEPGGESVTAARRRER